MPVDGFAQADTLYALPVPHGAPWNLHRHSDNRRRGTRTARIAGRWSRKPKAADVLKTLGRIVAVLACGLAALLLLQFLLSRRVETGTSVVSSRSVEAVRAPTIADVLAANIPTPTLTRVSFPRFSCRDAFPESTDEPEVVITNFGQAPMLEDADSMPAQWRAHYPEKLPPVQERLPRNPAVIRGPDGIGKYGGTWRRCTGSVADIGTKIGYETFVRHDPSGRLQPALAYKWTVEDSNRV